MSHSNGPSRAAAPPRRLCWSYQRRNERRQCVLVVDTAHRMCELRILFGDRGSDVRLERFHYVSKAMVRHCEYEAQFLAAGFSLDDFEVVAAR
jgi:hypothetical protein